MKFALSPIALLVFTTVAPAISITGVTIIPGPVSGGTANISYLPLGTTGAKLTGTLEAAPGCLESPGGCSLSYSFIVANSLSNAVEFTYDFSVSSTAVVWALLNSAKSPVAAGTGATSYSGGPLTLLTGSYEFIAASSSGPFTITIPNNSLDFTAVPEPSSAWLVLAAAAAAGAWRRRSF